MEDWLLELCSVLFVLFTSLHNIVLDDSALPDISYDVSIYIYIYISRRQVRLIIKNHKVSGQTGGGDEPFPGQTGGR